jgi:hypothetical protein
MALVGLSKDHVLVRGAARFNDLVYLSLEDKKLKKKGLAHTRLGSIDGGEVANVEDLSWRVSAMCVVKKPVEKLVAISEDGKVFTYVGGKSGEENIAQAHVLRGCKTIDQRAYACGMGRQVFARERERMWTAMHAPEGKDDEIVGFEDVDGFDAGELYAVGWNGEVWWREGHAWTRAASPAKTTLSAVCCAGDDHVYACGQAGTLLRGRRDRWEALTTPAQTDDLWDVRWFSGHLYVASYKALYRLEGANLVPVDFGRALPTTFYKLTDAEGVLWTIGEKNVCFFDGATWTRLE